MENVICTNCGAENPTSNKYCSRCGFELPKLQQQVIESAPVLSETFTSKINRRKGLFGTLLGLSLCVLIFFLVKSIFFNPAFFEKFKTAAIDKTMESFAEQLNKKCPIAIDEYTRLDDIKALPGRTLKYSYTLAVNKSEVDAGTLKEQMETQILNTVKVSPQMEVFRRYKTTFVHIFRDKNQQSILEISITPEMYGQ